MHNVISSVSYQRKIIALARDYARRRESFGARIYWHPLHNLVLARLEAETRGTCSLMLELARLLGLQEAGEMGDRDELLLRKVPECLSNLSS